ncbi:glycosyltransferase family 2 protein [Flavobacterium sp. MAHUQ-51]|uniref:glycosyltransferase family 2 protein n=1 Tax=Flavobacterium sp. GCM10022190 TaxID=3252639 RepID=UPI00362042F4
MSLISVIIPCYNQAQYLEEALQSVYNQTYQNWECIIVNDGSPDKTEEVAKKWLRKDNRFKYIYKENGGLSSARNIGLDLASGDFIQFLDADDLISKQKMELSLDIFLKFSDLDIVISNYNIIVGTNHQRIKPYYNLSDITFNYDTVIDKWDVDFAIPIHCAIFKASSIITLKFNENLKAKEDWLFWIQFFKNNPNFFYINQQLATYRKHSNSMTQSAKYMQESQNMVLDFIKQELSTLEYEMFLLKRLNLYKERYLNLSSKYSNLKNSMTYRLALKLKCMIKKIGLLVCLKKMLQKLRK